MRLLLSSYGERVVLSESGDIKEGTKAKKHSVMRYCSMVDEKTLDFQYEFDSFFYWLSGLLRISRNITQFVPEDKSKKAQWNEILQYGMVDQMSLDFICKFDSFLYRWILQSFRKLKLLVMMKQKYSEYDKQTNEK